MDTKVEQFFNNAKQWKAEMKLLRKIILDIKGLSETCKWMHPCYTSEGRNIVLIHGFKEYCALLFPKGALLQDPEGILVQQTANVQAARQIRFTDIQQVQEQEDFIKAYIREAIAIEESGEKVALKTTADYPVPEEFQAKLDENADLEYAFKALTPGRQRAYLFYFGQPKQSKTRASRVEKYLAHILNGKGIDD